MGRSDLLRVQDVRDAYRVIGECRDLGGDPALWQVRMFEGLCRLIGTPVVVGGEGLLDLAGGRVVPLSYLDSGLDAHGRHVYTAYMRDAGPAADPFIRALVEVPDGLVTRNRRQVVPDAAYHRSLVYNNYLRAGHVHHRLASMYRTAAGRALSMIHLQRPTGDRDFSPREQAVLTFFHGEIGPLIGRALVSAAEPGPESLSRRLRQTLACLVEGDSEKQIAGRLGLSPATVHQYVTALYRHFRVQSRGQLLAHVIKRGAGERWRRLADAGDGRSSAAEQPGDGAGPASSKR
jgi:DNA-binding CsgD family transcriptional regulator